MFRLGCIGCLTTVVVGALIVAAGWAALQITRAPERMAAPSSAADSVQAQRKIFELGRHAGEGKPRTATLSESEVNAFVRYNLAGAGDFPLRNLAIRLERNDDAEIAGQIAVHALLAMPPLSALASVVPDAWLDRPLWLTVRTHVTVERPDSGRAQRRLRLDVERFSLGRLRLPEFLLRVLLDPEALRFLRLPLPDSIETVNVESGRILIHAR